MSAGFRTGINVPNLDRLGVGTLLVLLVVIVAAVSMARAARQLRRLEGSAADPGQ
jgi:hypothetical protein